MAAWPGAAGAEVDVGVSITISEPGIYGRIDIGRFPQPRLVVATPVIVAPPRLRPPRPPAPVYLWVPPGHRKHWDKHCASYGACGVPVLFVRDDWYDGQIMPYATPERRAQLRSDRQGPGTAGGALPDRGPPAVTGSRPGPEKGAGHGKGPDHGKGPGNGKGPGGG
ncbi:MAG: hypothetical protein HYZ20_00120 [Burkholderiales bacterium]|nr:hypothetical protein [Burkholderiales bacterium]